jgi:hypothetical protein
MSRWRAAGLHFLISVIILAGALALMRLLWYQDFYFAAIGADGLIAILFGVDVTLGPLLTLIIFKSGKKGLKFDLACIGVCQLVALLYGMHTVFLARPAFAVFSVDRFNVVQAVEMDFSGAERSDFQAVPWTGPRWAAVKITQDDEAFRKALADVVFHGRDFSQHARYLVPYEEIKSKAVAMAKPIARLRRKGKGVQASERVQDFLSARGLTEEQVGYLPLKARAEDMAVIVGRPSGDILGVVRVNPW